MLNLEKRMKPREALEISPFATGVFTWKMNTRSIEVNDWLQVDGSREEDLLLKSIFRTTVRVSCISGSKSLQPEKRKKGIIPNISLNEIRLNAIFMLIVFISIKTI